MLQDFQPHYHDIISAVESIESGDQGAELAKTSKGPLLIFVQGPVIDRATRNKPQEGIDPSENADVNFWSKNLTLAAAELYKRGQVTEIIVMGGKTGGEQYGSEAALIKPYLIQAGIPEDVVTTEEGSDDTIANLINLANMKDAEGIQDKEKYQVLGTPYHLSRIQILMQLLRMPFDINAVFASDEILRFAARNSIGDISEDVLTDIERRLSMKGNLSPEGELNPNFEQLTDVERRLSSRANSFYQGQRGLERRDYFDRSIHDDLWTRELLEYPESWLGRVAEIDSSAHRSEILKQVEELWPHVLQDRFGINRELDSPEDIQLKLTQIKKKGLSPDDIKRWIKQNQTVGWPEEVEARLNILIQKRRQRN